MAIDRVRVLMYLAVCGLLGVQNVGEVEDTEGLDGDGHVVEETHHCGRVRLRLRLRIEIED